jgi:hypothetical protein
MKQCHPLKYNHRLSYLVLDICVRTQSERKTGGGPVSLHVAYFYSILKLKYLLECAW